MIVHVWDVVHWRTLCGLIGVVRYLDDVRPAGEMAGCRRCLATARGHVLDDDPPGYGPGVFVTDPIAAG